jgi:predicted esterase
MFFQRYTRFVKFLALFPAIFLFSSACLGQAGVSATAEKPQPGQMLERVVCGANPAQSYALYLPSNYSPNRSWPVIFAFDPGARGKVPVELMKDAAEHNGFIVLGSNNSRNGAWKPEVDAADAMLQDAQARFSVDLKRIYFAGFSGGARVASQLAQLCKCSAGVMLSGAGFSRNSLPQRDTPFPVFSAVGNADFNYSELVPLQDKLEQAGYPHWLRVFDGVHEWAPAPVMEEALAWFRVQAMRANREARDEAFVGSQLKTAVSTAEKQSANGEQLSAWRQYKQIAATYEGISDVGALKDRAEELGRQKSVQEALKHERNDFEDQQNLSDQVLAALQTKDTGEVPHPEDEARVGLDIRGLRQRAESEKRPERAIVLKRALAGIFVGAIETGNDELSKKEYASAARYFSAAAEARPDAEWPLRQLAMAQALDKNRKAALETLRKAKAKARDAGEFSRWVESEPAFAELRARQEVP